MLRTDGPFAQEPATPEQALQRLLALALLEALDEVERGPAIPVCLRCGRPAIQALPQVWRCPGLTTTWGGATP